MLHCLPEIRQQAARPRLGAQDHTNILAVLHLGTRHGGPTQEVIKGRKDTPARRSRQIHQMDRGSTHHQLHCPHICQLHQINNLQVRVPHSIITENDTNFTAAAFQNFCEELGIKVNYASVAHP